MHSNWDAPDYAKIEKEVQDTIRHSLFGTAFIDEEVIASLALKNSEIISDVEEAIIDDPTPMDKLVSILHDDIMEVIPTHA